MTKRNKSQTQLHRCMLVCAVIGLVMVVAAQSVQAQDKPTTVTLGLSEFPPYSYTDSSSGQCVGSAIDLTRDILRTYNIELSAICAPALRVYTMLETGEVDFTINIKSTPYIQDKVTFSTIPFGSLEVILVSRDDKGFKKMVSAIRGFSYHGVREKMIERGYVFQDNPGSIDAVKVFLRGRTRHLLTYEGPYTYYLHQEGSDASDFDVEPILSVPTYIAISNGSNHLDVLLQSFNDHAEVNNLRRYDDLLTDTN